MLQADRNLIDKIRRDESTGEVMSLVGKLEGSRMGDLAKRTKPPTAAQIEPKTKRKKDDVIMTSSTFEKLKSGALSSAGEEELSAVYYRPKTKETKNAYEVLLSFIQQHIGDQVRAPVSLIRSH